MSQSVDELRQRIESATGLQSIVETMRTLALVNIRRAEQGAAAAAAYMRNIHVALHVATAGMRPPAARAEDEPPTLLVLSSNQGLCGQFNERAARRARELIQAEGGVEAILCVGYRGADRLEAAGYPVAQVFDAPTSIEAVNPLVRQIYLALSARRRSRRGGDWPRVIVVHNRHTGGTSFEEVHFQLLPADSRRWRSLPGDEPGFRTLPQVFAPSVEAFLHDAVRELLYIDLFRALIESFAAENAARLGSMQGAADNIEELLAELQAAYRAARQDGITNELMDIVAGSLVHEEMGKRKQDFSCCGE